jgi:hypothetical protein
LLTGVHPQRAGSGSRTVAPILRLTRQRQVEALRWCPCSQDVIAAASAADGDVHLFDLGVCDEAPTDVLLGEAQVRQRAPACSVALLVAVH